jgi:hypothetical protein
VFKFRQKRNEGGIQGFHLFAEDQQPLEFGAVGIDVLQFGQIAAGCGGKYHPIAGAHY